MDLHADLCQLDKEFTDFKVNTSFKLSSLQYFIEKSKDQNRAQTEALEQELSKKTAECLRLHNIAAQHSAEQVCDQNEKQNLKALLTDNSNLRSQILTLKDNAKYSKFQITMLASDTAALTRMLEQANAKADAAEAKVLSLERRLEDAFEELSRLHNLALEREEKWRAIVALKK